MASQARAVRRTFSGGHIKLSKETEAAIQAFKAWSRANDRADGTERRNRDEERAQDRLSAAVKRVPKEDFAEYFRITEAWRHVR